MPFRANEALISDICATRKPAPVSPRHGPPSVTWGCLLHISAFHFADYHDHLRRGEIFSRQGAFGCNIFKRWRRRRSASAFCSIISPPLYTPGTEAALCDYERPAHNSAPMLFRGIFAFAAGAAATMPAREARADVITRPCQMFYHSRPLLFRHFYEPRALAPS